MNFLSKFLYVLPSKPIILLPWLLAFICSSILEVFGIGIIGPFIGLASHSGIIYQNIWLHRAYTILGVKQESHFIALIGILVILIFCFKSLIVWYTQSRIFKFSYLQQEKLISRLMHSYIEAPYELFINKNTVQVINNVVGQTKTFTDKILSTFLVSVSNLVTILAISFLLCLVSPVAVLSLLLILSPLLVLFNAFKGKVKAWSKALHEADLGILRGINHGLGGFKETRVIGCGSYFEEETLQQAHQMAEVSIKFYAFKLAPRFIIEVILVVFLVGLISIALLFNQGVEELIPVLSIFALASIRLIPACTNLANGLSILRNNSHQMNQLYLDLKELENAHMEAGLHLPMMTEKSEKGSYLENKLSKISFIEKIVLDRVSFRYGSEGGNVLDQVSITIPKGQAIGLIGRSGAGKTTLVDVILGLLIPQSGDIQVDGLSIYSDLRSWQNLIGYIPQSIFLIDDTIERNIAFGLPDHQIDAQRLEKAIRAAQLTEVIEHLPNGVKTRVGERGIMLSGGQRQRVGIARALYHKREILVLDEATSALDNETERLVTEAIQALSGIKTMIIIAHRLTTLEHCDQVYLLDKGAIVRSGSLQEVMLEDYLLTDVES
ncbi:MAG: ABC transporter ATP-binding protein/permease [Scytolyngbya sp. HA4215-MV1]|jgi:ABC-type multidrug transport system fused ATPase/permease subunit|nr:ABC transporter ATP-binding protein/permease [Scytolyngbya sp. HA4215-MV1]